MGAVEVLHEQSQIGWFNPGSATGVLFSELITPEQAELLKGRFHKALEVEIRSSEKEPGKVRLFLNADQVANHIANKRILVVPDFVPAIPLEAEEPDVPFEVLAPLLPPLPNPAPRLNISEAEWQAAEAYFRDPVNQKKGKMRKKDASDYDETLHKGQEGDEEKGIAKKDATRHSFLYINGRIYAVANGEYRTGSGSFGNVKVIQDRKGNSDVVKIENYDEKIRRLTENNEGDIEKEIGERVGMVKGDLVRPLMTIKAFKKYYTQNKLYTILEDRGKEELLDVLNSNVEQLKKPNKGLPLAIQCCNAIQSLHDRRIIHRDVKPENFTTNKKGEIYLVNTIDFGLSAFMPEGKDTLIAKKAVGTPGYAAPEVYLCQYYFVTDVFALGYFFPYLAVPDEIVSEMIREDPLDRMTLGAATAKLIDLLRITPDIDEQARQLIADFDKRQQETLNWIVNSSGISTADWHEDHSGNKMLYKTSVMSLEDVYDVFQLMPDSSHYAEVVQVSKGIPEFQVVIDEQKLRLYMVKEQRIKQFNDIKSEVSQQLGAGLAIDVVNRDDTHARGVHLNITATIDNLDKLFAIRDALQEMQIPFKFVQTDVDTDPRFSIVMQDNVLSKIQEPHAFAEGMDISQNATDEANEVKAKWIAMQAIIQSDVIRELDVVRELRFSKIEPVLFSQGEPKGTQLIMESPNTFYGNEFLEVLRELGINATNPPEKNFFGVKIVIDEHDILKIANQPEILQQVLVKLDERERAREALFATQMEEQNRMEVEPKKEAGDIFKAYMFIEDLLNYFGHNIFFSDELDYKEFSGELPEEITPLKYALKRMGIPETAFERYKNQFTLRLNDELFSNIAAVMPHLPQPNPVEAFIKECELGALLTSSSEEFAKEVKRHRAPDPVKVGRWSYEKSSQSLNNLSLNEDVNGFLEQLAENLHRIEKQPFKVDEKATLAYILFEELANQLNEFEVPLKRFCEAIMEDLANEFEINMGLTDEEKISIFAELESDHDKETVKTERNHPK